MMASPSTFMGPVNIGNPNEFTILELAEKIIALTGSKSKIINQPLPPDDPMMRQPDISLAKKELDWCPRIELEEGLLKTIAYFKATI
jgi:UDP-glucuronate decarboxylase